jgi:DNA-binding NarL/FixJ family response regulator
LFLGLIQEILEGVGYRTLTAGSGEEALELARKHAPLVVLLDIHLPGLNGYEVCRVLRDEHGHALGIAFISGAKTDKVDISSGLLVGADDYLVKGFEASELVARVGALMRRAKAKKGDEVSSSRKLTGREVEVLQLLADGLDQKTIAERLSISSKTVAIHIEHILGKLEVHSRAQAVAAAYRENLLG